jgi:hypothetical protein
MSGLFFVCVFDHSSKPADLQQAVAINDLSPNLAVEFSWAGISIVAALREEYRITSAA